MDPSRPTSLALGYWPARALTAAIEVGIFDALADGPATAGELGVRLELPSPSLPDLLEALAGLGVLGRDADRFALVEPVDVGLAAVAGAEAFRAWADLPGALRGEDRPSMFDRLEGHELVRFADAMAAAAAPAHEAVAGLDLGATVTDVGGADGRLAVALARRHPTLHVTVLECPAMAALASTGVAAAGLGDRIDVVAGDAFTDPIPPADTVVLSLVLLDWPPDRKRALLASAAKAARRVVVADRFDGGEQPARSTFELLRSLHLLVTTGEAHHYSVEELERWLAEAGFGAPQVHDAGHGFSVAVAERPG